MSQSAVNDVRIPGATLALPVYEYAQVLEGTGGRTVSLSVTLKNMKFSGTGTNATGTLRAKVQGSNDRGNWYPIPAAEIVFSVLGNAGDTKPGESKVKDAGRSAWLWVRVEYKLSVDLSVTVDALLSATLNVN